MDFIFSGDNIPFAVSIGLMLVMALFEGIGYIFGMGLSTLFDSLIPDIDLDVDLDMPDDMEPPSVLANIGAWLKIGEVPLIILLIVFLTVFGLLGFILQSAVLSLLSFMLPWYVAIIPVFLLTLPVVRISGSFFAKILPQDESSAVSSSSFIGQIAEVTLGTAKKALPAQGKLKDKFGQTHYIMVEPDNEGEEFPQGSKVLLVKQNGAKFFAIKDYNGKLTD